LQLTTEDIYIFDTKNLDLKYTVLLFGVLHFYTLTFLLLLGSSSVWKKH